MGKRALFLDRDGVLIKDTHLLTKKEDIIILPKTCEALVRLKAHGFLIFLLSNQSVVSRGLLSLDDCIHLNQLILDIIDPENEIFEEIYLCPYHPHADIEEFKVDHQWRKPNPGAILFWKEKYDLDLNNSFMVGDRDSDIECGKRAGCKTVLIGEGIGGFVDNDLWVTPKNINSDLKFKSLEELAETLS